MVDPSLVALWRWCLPVALSVCCKPFDSPLYFANERTLRFNAWVNDHFGRKAGFWSVGVLTIIGAVILSAAENVGTSLPFRLAIAQAVPAMLAVGRAISGFGQFILPTSPRASSYVF
jgi:anaerobic C4-dicarboxylate transporter